MKELIKEKDRALANLATSRLSGKNLRLRDLNRKEAKALRVQRISFVVLRDTFVFFVKQDKMIILTK